MEFKLIGLVTVIVLLLFVISGCIEENKEGTLPAGNQTAKDTSTQKESVQLIERIISENEEHKTATNEYISSFEKALEEEGWAKKLFDEIKSKTSKFKTEDIKKNPEVQKEVAEIVFDAINREIEPEDGIFNLSDVLRTKKADCLGYSPVYWIIGKKLGLDVGIIGVYKDSYGKYLEGNESHYCNVLILSNGTEILVDLAYDEFDIKHQVVGNKIVSNEEVYSIMLVKYGGLLFNSNKFSEAEKEYREAIRINPNYAYAHYNLGVLLHESNKFSAAEKEYREAIRINHDIAYAHYNLGLLLTTLNKFSEAEKEYREGIKINPNDADAHYNLGLLLTTLNKFSEAEKEYREAIRINPSYADAHFNLGILLDYSNKFSDAEKEYRKAIEINPNFAGAYYNLGILLYDNLNRAEEATNVLRTAARLYREQGDYEKANKIDEVLNGL